MFKPLICCPDKHLGQHFLAFMRLNLGFCWFTWNLDFHVAHPKFYLNNAVRFLQFLSSLSWAKFQMLCCFRVSEVLPAKNLQSCLQDSHSMLHAKNKMSKAIILAARAQKLKKLGFRWFQAVSGFSKDQNFHFDAILRYDHFVTENIFCSHTVP